MIKIALCLVLNLAVAVDAGASIRTNRGQLVFDLGPTDTDASIAVERGGEVEVVALSSLKSLISAFKAGITIAAPNHAAEDVSIDVQNGMVVASAGDTSHSVSPSQSGAEIAAMFAGLQIGQSLDTYGFAVHGAAIAANTDAVADLTSALGDTNALLTATKETLATTTDNLATTQAALETTKTALTQATDTTVELTDKLAESDKAAAATTKQLESLEDLFAGLQTTSLEALELPQLEATVAAKIGSGGGSDGAPTFKQYSNAGKFTWTKPAGVTRIKVYVTGGGAGGGSHNSDDAQGGGGAGGTCINIIDVTKIQTTTIIVGAGGDGGTGNSPTSGGNGASSSFGTHCIATGGVHVPTWGIGGPGGNGDQHTGNNAMSIIGGYGHAGNIDGSGNSEAGGNGGDSYWGGGGRGATNWGNRSPGRWGGGGGGNQANRGDAAASGNGGSGVVVIEMFGGSAGGATSEDSSSSGASGTIGTGTVANRAAILKSRVWALANKALVLEDGDSDGAGGFIGTKVYRKAGSYVKSSKVTTVKVVVTGGGGGGGSHNGDDAQGGGGAGGTCIATVDMTEFAVGYKIPIAVGAGGLGCDGNNNQCGQNGGQSKFGKYCIANGGVPPKTWGLGGKGGSSVNGDLNIMGGFGHSGNIDGSGNSEAGGNGGDTLFWKGGGSGASHWGNRRPGNYGGGGGGGHGSQGDGNQKAGQGGTGVVLIEEYGSSGVVARREKTKLDDFGDNVATDGVAFGSGSLACSDPGPTNNGEKTSGTACIKNINDGKYGDENQWVANPESWKGDYFIGIKLKEPIVLGAVALSRDHKGRSSNRMDGLKQMQYTSVASPNFRTPASKWHNIGSAFKLASRDQEAYATTEVIATGIRVVVTNQEDAIDELEVYGTPVHENALSTTETLDYIKAEMASVAKVVNGIDSSDTGQTKGLVSMQIFKKTGAGTWKRPKGVTSIKVYVTGGGGGGGSHNSDDAQGGGGAGGTCIARWDVTDKDAQNFVIGKGGDAAVGNTAGGGGVGTPTKFGSCIGHGGEHTKRWGIGGNGGLAEGGTINIKGGYGHTGNIDGHGNSEQGGNGGDSVWNGGGGGASAWGNNSPGKYGGGGGGNHANRGENKDRGRGGDGIIVVEEFA